MERQHSWTVPPRIMYYIQQTSPIDLLLFLSRISFMTSQIYFTLQTATYVHIHGLYFFWPMSFVTSCYYYSMYWVFTRHILRSWNWFPKAQRQANIYQTCSLCTEDTASLLLSSRSSSNVRTITITLIPSQVVTDCTASDLVNNTTTSRTVCHQKLSKHTEWWQCELLQCDSLHSWPWRWRHYTPEWQCHILRN